MAQNAQRIHAGPADLTIYDSSNGYLYLGYVQDCEIKTKSRNHEIVDGNIRQYGSEYKFEATLLQSDYGMYEAIEARRAVRQTIYIVGANSLTTMANMYVNAVPVFPYRSDKPHVLELSAQTRVETDVNKYYNLFGTEGKFETDTNSDGLANGWTETDLASKSLQTSWRTGNCQRVGTSAAGPVVYYNKTCPFESPKKITFSIYARSNGTAGRVRLSIYLLNSAGSTITSTVGSYEALVDGVERRLSITGNLVPNAEVRTIRAHMSFDTNSQTIEFDDAQLEFYGDDTTWIVN